MIIKIFGFILIFTGIFDSIKYYWFANKIIKSKSAKSYSRKGLNVAILHDSIKIIYAIFIKDIFIGFSSLIALITMCYCWWQVYKFYPFKYRGLQNFKRPNIILYLINSILPNRIRKRL